MMRDRLKDDPTFQTIASTSLSTLGSQPTISRLENDIDWSSVARLSRVGLDWFCRHAFAPDKQPRELILDLDSTADPTHGQQQFALFHGGYNQHMYHPLCWVRRQYRTAVEDAAETRLGSQRQFRG
jgi:hypothetical protein